ncbi:hypothetical protein IPG41_06010 [Candidatus Peregrinibacteria bacterium]|nr:MAG: hypothetical protein IPG41_06010 [Candidatus Peregrinibacteria bacterium]
MSKGHNEEKTEIENLVSQLESVQGDMQKLEREEREKLRNWLKSFNSSNVIREENMPLKARLESALGLPHSHEGQKLPKKAHVLRERHKEALKDGIKYVHGQTRIDANSLKEGQLISFEGTGVYGEDRPELTMNGLIMDCVVTQIGPDTFEVTEKDCEFDRARTGASAPRYVFFKEQPPVDLFQKINQAGGKMLELQGEEGQTIYGVSVQRLASVTVEPLAPEESEVAHHMIATIREKAIYLEKPVEDALRKVDGYLTGKVSLNELIYTADQLVRNKYNNNPHDGADYRWIQYLPIIDLIGFVTGTAFQMGGWDKPIERNTWKERFEKGVDSVFKENVIAYETLPLSPEPDEDEVKARVKLKLRDASLVLERLEEEKWHKILLRRGPDKNAPIGSWRRSGFLLQYSIKKGVSESSGYYSYSGNGIHWSGGEGSSEIEEIIKALEVDDETKAGILKAFGLGSGKKSQEEGFEGQTDDDSEAEEFKKTMDLFDATKTQFQKVMEASGNMEASAPQRKRARVVKDGKTYTLSLVDYSMGQVMEIIVCPIGDEYPLQKQTTIPSTNEVDLAAEYYASRPEISVQYTQWQSVNYEKPSKDFIALFKEVTGEEFPVLPA